MSSVFPFQNEIILGTVKDIKEISVCFYFIKNVLFNRERCGNVDF